jgi:pyruvate dehydrogenase (quinone)
LLNVRVNPQQFVMPPYIEAKAVMGMALYSAKAVLAGRGGDVLEMTKENSLRAFARRWLSISLTHATGAP